MAKSEVQEDQDIVYDDGLGDILDEAQLGGQEDEETPETEESEVQKDDDGKEAPAGEESEDTAGQDDDKREDKKEEKKPKKAEKAEKKEDGEEEVSFTYRGKKYSLDDLKADPDLRNKILTGANQQSHYQELYGQTKTELQKLEERLKAFEESQARAAAEEQRRRQAESGPKLTPEKLNAAYQENVKKMVDEGWLEPDLQELYPNAVAGVMSMRDEMFVRLGQVEAVLGSLIQHTEGDIQNRQVMTEQQRHQAIYNRINQIFDGMAQEGGIFAPLASPETRVQFLTELEQSLNPMVDQLVSDPKVLRNLWIGANHDALIAEAAAKKAAVEDRRNQQLRDASGEGRGTTKSGTGGNRRPLPGEAEGWADL